ncbi:MAG: DUF418 domain-containing protein [Phycisphaerales bacterium]|nr:DUF418 domain-containing protein [Phycisphaerales bacterium]
MIRGIALLGIVIENVRFFSMPTARAIMGPWTIDGSVLDRVVVALDLAFGHQKFLALFTVLFGFGLAAQRARLVASDVLFLPFELRRIIWLGAIGLLHAFGLFFGDILFVFAGIGLMTLPLLGRSTRMRLTIGLLLILFSGMLVARAPAQRWLSQTAEPTALVVDEAREETTAPPPTTPTFDGSSPRATGPWIDVVRERAGFWRGSMSYAVRFYGWLLFGLVLLGTVLQERGFFRPDARPWRSRVAIGCLTVGLPLEVMHALPPEFRGAGAGAAAWWAFIHPLAAAAVALGYAGIITNLVERGSLPLARWFAAAGRMSLTAYLLESLLLAATFRWWGLGWFGEVGNASAVLIALAAYAIVLAACILWNRSFLLGPLEWIWRWFTYLQRPPLRRDPSPRTTDAMIDLRPRTSGPDDKETLDD